MVLVAILIATVSAAPKASCLSLFVFYLFIYRNIYEHKNDECSGRAMPLCARPTHHFNRRLLEIIRFSADTHTHTRTHIRRTSLESRTNRSIRSSVLRVLLLTLLHCRGTSERCRAGDGRLRRNSIMNVMCLRSRCNGQFILEVWAAVRACSWIIKKKEQEEKVD